VTTPDHEPGSAGPEAPAGPGAYDDEDEARRRAEEKFVEGVVARGEAAEAEDGELPPGATHEIVEEGEGKPPRIVRRRFSAF
jgi:hypothetical protein